MEEHEVKQVEIVEENIFKGELVQYPARYEYCSHTDTYTTYDDTIDTNDILFKDAYRRKVGLLTSEEIISIRDKYGVSQKDFSKILGWGSSTITRYENHQVQDVVHDDVLRKINSDPKWFIDLLNRAKDELSGKAYEKYLCNAKEAYYKNRDCYLRDLIEASYVRFEGNPYATGNTNLNLDKAIEMINYLALKVADLHKVKLMKMMWFSDFLNYKREKKSITGFAYNALPMGAVPECHEALVLLDGVFYEEVQYDDHTGYKFKPAPNFQVKSLSEAEINIIDEIVQHFKDYATKEIIDRMHKEEAYLKTGKNQLISYEYAERLSIEVKSPCIMDKVILSNI